MKLFFAVAPVLLCTRINAMIHVDGGKNTINFDTTSMAVNASEVTFNVPVVATDFFTGGGRSLLGSMDASDVKMDERMNASDAKMDAMLVKMDDLTTLMVTMANTVSNIYTAIRVLTPASPLNGTPPSWLASGWIKSGLNNETIACPHMTGGKVNANGGKSSGKWYAEIHINEFSPYGGAGLGVISNGTHFSPNNDPSLRARTMMMGRSGDPASTSTHLISTGSPIYGPNASLAAGNNIGIAIDLDGGDLEFFLNGVGLGSVVSIVPSLNYSTGVWAIHADKARPVVPQLSIVNITILDQHVYAAPAGYSFWTA